MAKSKPTARGKRRNRGTFKPGHPKLGGRKVGTPNKISRDIKQGLLDAYEMLGGPLFFLKLGKNRADRKVIANLFGRMLPLQVTGGDDADTTAEKVRQRLAGIDKATGEGE